jgi:hypothetical protein
MAIILVERKGESSLLLRLPFGKDVSETDNQVGQAEGMKAREESRVQ